jgi:hypothetical protein
VQRVGIVQRRKGDDHVKEEAASGLSMHELAQRTAHTGSEMAGTEIQYVECVCEDSYYGGCKRDFMRKSVRPPKSGWYKAACPRLGNLSAIEWVADGLESSGFRPERQERIRAPDHSSLLRPPVESATLQRALGACRST